MKNISVKKIIIAAAAALIAAVIIIALKYNNKNTLILTGASGYNVTFTSKISDVTNYSEHIKLLMYAKNVEKSNDNNIIYFLVNNITNSSIKNVIIPVEMADNGNIIHIEYPAVIENDDMLVSLFEYFFQTVTPVINDTTNNWEDVVYLDNGYVKSHYTKKDNIIKKSKSIIEDYNVNIDIKNSDITLTLSKSFWLASAESSEDIHISMAGITDSDSSNKINLTQIPYDNKFDKYFTKPYSELIAEYKNNKQKIFDDKRNYTVKYDKLDNNTLSSLMSDFNSKFNNMNDNSNSSYFAMMKLLQNNPQLIAAIPQKIKEIGESNDVAARMIIGLLEKIGTADAQNALTIIMKDDEIITANRIRAIVALNGVLNPSDHTIDSLIQISENRDGDDNNFIADTSVLALGSAGSKLLGKTEKYNDVRNYFDANLSSNVETTYNTLLGIGNTSDEYFYNKVVPYLTSNNDYDREAAVYAAANTNFDEFVGGAEKFLAGESSANVRSKVYDAFTATSRPTTQMTNLVKENFKEESTVVQNSMLNYLKRNVKQPEAEKYLQELMSSNLVTPQEKIDIRHVLGSK